MGRDEHRHKKNNVMAQTPKNQLRDGKDVEYAEEFADHADRESQARSLAADARAKGK